MFMLLLIIMYVVLHISTIVVILLLYILLLLLYHYWHGVPCIPSAYFVCVSAANDTSPCHTTPVLCAVVFSPLQPLHL